MNLDLTKIVDIEVDDIEMNDYPDFSNAYISESWIEITNNEAIKFHRSNPDIVINKGKYFRRLTDSELDWLNEQGDFVYENVLKKIY